MNFLSVMNAASSNADSSLERIHDMSFGGDDGQSKYLKAYARSKAASAATPPVIKGKKFKSVAKVQEIRQQKSKEATKFQTGAQAFPDPGGYGAGPSKETVESFRAKIAERKAKEQRESAEKAKKERDALLDARIRANDGKLTKKIVKQFALTREEAFEKYADAAQNYNYFNQRDPEEEARLELLRIRRETVDVAKMPKLSETSKEYLERKARKLAASMAKKKDHKPSKSAAEQKDFDSIMKMAQHNSKKVAANGFQKLPSPPPPPPTLKPGPATFKRKQELDIMLSKPAPGSIKQKLAEERDKLKPKLARKPSSRSPSPPTRPAPSSTNKNSGSKKGGRRMATSPSPTPTPSPSPPPRHSLPSSKQYKHSSSATPSSSASAEDHYRQMKEKYRNREQQQQQHSAASKSSSSKYKHSADHHQVHRSSASSSSTTANSKSHSIKPQQSSSSSTTSDHHHRHRSSTRGDSNHRPSSKHISASSASTQHRSYDDREHHRNNYSSKSASSKQHSSSSDRRHNNISNNSSSSDEYGHKRPKSSSSINNNNYNNSNSHSANNNNSNKSASAATSSGNNNISQNGSAAVAAVASKQPKLGQLSEAAMAKLRALNRGKAPPAPTIKRPPRLESPPTTLSTSKKKSSKESMGSSVSNNKHQRPQQQRSPSPGPVTKKKKHHRNRSESPPAPPSNNHHRSNKDSRQSKHSSGGGGVDRDDRNRPHPQAKPQKQLPRGFSPPRALGRYAFSGNDSPPAYMRRGGGGGGRLDDFYDEEEDSEMDDFIDDTEDPMAAMQETREVSKAIRDVFNYDKRRFAGEKWSRDDDRAMQANFREIQKEEVRSARLGAKEDYEEYLREQEEKKRSTSKPNKK